jgi:hypothetical protein
MLIRKAAVAAASSDSKTSKQVATDAERLEILLTRYEKNLELEAFYIRRKDNDSLLEILPAQGSLIDSITTILGTVQVSPAERVALDRRLGAADAKREENKRALEAEFNAVKKELEEMNAARVRLMQVRKLSRTAYTDDEPVRTENWA